MNAVNSEYNTLLKSKRWFDKRKIILARDRNKCRSCGSNENLQVHHRQYQIIKRTGLFQLPWKYDNRYLVTLCNKCHKNGHQVYKVPSYIIN